MFKKFILFTAKKKITYSQPPHRINSPMQANLIINLINIFTLEVQENVFPDGK